jgi:hypothetical protein
MSDEGVSMRALLIVLDVDWIDARERETRA